MGWLLDEREELLMGPDGAQIGSGRLLMFALRPSDLRLVLPEASFT